MKKLASWFSCIAVLAFLGFIATPARAQQAQQPNDSTSERLQRLERRVNELADRQQQTRPRGSVDQQQQGQPPQMGAPGRPMSPPPGVPPQDGRARKGLKGLLTLFFLGCIIFNILIAIWIFGDIRRRGTGSGLFVVLALIAGVPAAIIYALVRIGDNKLVERVVTTP
jgi:hypothetical protein